MKKKIGLILKLLVVLQTVFTFSLCVALAEDNINIYDLLAQLDLSEAENFFNGLSKEEQNVLGGSFRDLILNLSNGTNVITDSLLPHALSLVLDVVKNILPGFSMLLGVILITTILNGIKSDFAKKSIHSIINFASACLIGIILCYSLAETIEKSFKFIKDVFYLAQTVFPIIFSILITMGASSSATVFQGSLTVFLSLLSILISSFIMPITIASCVLSVLTNVSNSLNLGKFPVFMTNISKKILNGVFIIFSALLTLQGISAQVYDSVGIRIAKFSLNKYIPIVGGYLSSGFDFLYSGSVLLKNSVGIAFVFVLLISVLPLIIRLLCMKLLTEFLSVISSITGNDTTVKMLNGINQCVSLITTCVVGISLTLSGFTVITVLSFNSIA